MSGGHWAVMASRLQPMPTPGSHGATRGTRCHHSWLHQGCVCWGGGAGPSPVVARGWAGRGDRGGRRVTPRRWVGDQGLGAPSSAMRVRSRGLLAGTWPGLDGSRGTGGGDSQMGTSDPRLWPGAEGTPRGADQGGGRFGLGREEGWTHLPLRTWGPRSLPGPRGSSGLGGLGPLPHVSGATGPDTADAGVDKAREAGSPRCGPLGLVSVRVGAGVQGALSVRTRALRVASSARLLWCDSPPSLGLPFWYLL